MIKTFCDRCGTAIRENHKSFVIRLERDDVHFFGRIQYELCTQCKKDLSLFLKMEEPFNV